MKLYQHILIATDLTEKSEKIGYRAKNLADHYHSTLSIIHVVEFSPVIYGGEYALPLEPEIEDTAKADANHAIAKLARLLKIPPKNRYVTKGTAKDALLKLIEDKNIDLLVMGNHQYAGLSFLLGSIAHTMFHKMPCDILAVKID